MPKYIFEYDLETNSQDHDGTPDPTISIEFVLRDVFNQVSEATQGDFTNPLPTQMATPTARTSGSVVVAHAVATSDKDIKMWEWDVQHNDGGGFESIDGSPFEGGLTFSFIGEVI